MAQAGSFVVTDPQEFTLDTTSPPTWDQLHPVLPLPVTQEQAITHHNTRQVIGALPRNILGIAILRALGMRPPMPPRPPQLVTREMVEESNRRIQKMREELAAEQSAGIVDTTEQAVEELHDSVTRSEAQTAFEAQMRAKALRGTFQA
jgi:ABC-type phosphate transport system auxiliary subunit